MLNPSKKPFINPLTQATPPDDATTSQETSTSTFTSTPLPSEVVTRRKRGAQAFEKTHERITSWVDIRLKEQFDRLAQKQGKSKTELLNEAISDLLIKYNK